VPLSKPAKWISIVLQITSAAILVQTLFFKFTAAPESVYIFTKVGAEPWGRIGSGVVELIAAALLLLPSRVTIGALLALGVMAGAIGSHLTVLGIEIMGDGGLLFGLAVYVFVASGVIVYLRRAELPVAGPMLVSRLAGGRR
jgi:putative oxidoreductase